MDTNRHNAVYGNVVIPRIYCGKCKDYCLVIKGIKQCCDEPIEYEFTNKSKVICEPQQIRKRPPKKERDLLWVLQKGKCLYCDKKIGTIYERNGKILFTKECYDHYIPYSFSFDNRKTNFVLACHICNGIKSNKMFNTVEEVREYVFIRREKKGYTFFEDLPTMPQENDKQ